MKKKANDKIPQDEMLLAEALAAARARGMRHATGGTFKDASNSVVFSSDKAVYCCAIGALALAGVVDEKTATEQCSDAEGELMRVYIGNDNPREWTSGWVSGDDGDYGESLGWAFRCAMTQEDES